MLESRYGCTSAEVKISGFLNHLASLSKSSVMTLSMSITVVLPISSTDLEEYSVGEFAKSWKRPRLNIGAAARPAAATNVRLSRSRRVLTRFLDFICNSFRVNSCDSWIVLRLLKKNDPRITLNTRTELSLDQNW